MTKSTLTPQRLAEILAASPEGFFSQSELDRFAPTPDITATVIAEAAAMGQAGHEGNFVYDITRLTAEQVRERSAIYVGSVPSLGGDGAPNVRPIKDRIQQRNDRLSRLHDPVLERLVNRFEDT